MSMNNVTLFGHLTRDPELKFTTNNTAVCTLSLALNDGYKAKDGSYKENTHYIDCECWAKTAEMINAHYKKGDGMLLRGSLKQDRWQNSEGQNRSKLMVRIQEVVFTRRKDSSGEADQPREKLDYNAASEHGPHPTIEEIDVPFGPHGIDGRVGV